LSWKKKNVWDAAQKKSIYGLKQAFRRYLKFVEMIKKFGFKDNEKDNYVYAKLENGKFIFLIFYVDYIFLASSDVNLLLDTKKFLSSNFNMKDLDETLFTLGIEVHRDRRKGVLGLSQVPYLEKVLRKYSMHASKSTPAPIVKGHSFGKFQSPRNQEMIDQIKSVPCASAIEAYRSLKRAKVRIYPDVGHVSGMFWHKSSPDIDHWNGVKNILQFCKV
jgi:hypothetical protein